jgi:hypothetical protein
MRSELNEFFDFERLYQNELDRIYAEKGYKCQRIVGIKNKEYDCVLIKNGQEYHVEEKGERYLFPNAPIEIVQDVLSCNLGWYYNTRASHVLFIYYDEIIPSIVYLIKMGPLRKNLNAIIRDNQRSLKFALKGFGITVNICIPWKYLIDTGICSVFHEFITEGIFK